MSQNKTNNIRHARVKSIINSIRSNSIQTLVLEASYAQYTYIYIYCLQTNKNDKPSQNSPSIGSNSSLCAHQHDSRV